MLIKKDGSRRNKKKKEGKLNETEKSRAEIKSGLRAKVKTGSSESETLRQTTCRAF